MLGVGLREGIGGGIWFVELSFKSGGGTLKGGSFFFVCRYGV